jgi:hypothetical protein
MGHGRQVKRAAWLFALSAFAQDPVDTLEKARDKVLAAAPRLPKYVCTETIERSYYSRKEPPKDPPSCERILVDRKKGKYSMNLDATDRLRVSVAETEGGEIYAWTGTAPYAHGVVDILQSGPIATGAFAAHLLDIFGNPSVRFRLIEERLDTIEYGFRVPVEASRFVVGAGAQWLPTGYGGFIHIDKNSLDVRRFICETDELPPETLMCEASATLEFPSRPAAGASWFVPSQSRTHEVMRDASETDNVATLSDCRESSAPPPPPPAPAHTVAPLPPDLKVSLAFNTPIDTEVAAAGDLISATVTEPVMTGLKIVLHQGATVTGRFVGMRRQRDPPLFLISIAFDTLENNGASSPFYAKLIDPPPATEKIVYQTMLLTGHGLKDWPQGRFGFRPRAHLVVSALFKSKWLTTAPLAAK